MAWLAVNRDKTEVVLGGWKKPTKDFVHGIWWSPCDNGDIYWNKCIELPKGTIYKLIGKSLTWYNSPVELKEEIK